MAPVISRPWTSQPQVAAPLNTALYPDTAALFNFSGGLSPVNAGTYANQTWSATAGASSIIGRPNGLSVSNGSGNHICGAFGRPGANVPVWFVSSFTHGAFQSIGSGSNVIAGYGDTGLNGIQVTYNSSQALTVYANTAAISTSVTLVAGRQYSIFVSRTSAGDAYVYVNGSLVGSGTGFTGIFPASSVLRVLGDGTTTRYSLGSVSMVAFSGISGVDRSAIGSALSSNPWQLFAPQRRTMWPAPAVVSGFKPAWITRRSKVIGAGVI